MEHFNTSDRGLVGRFDTDDFDDVANLDFSALDTAGNDGTATFDGEHVFDRHQERFVDFTLRLGNPAVDGVHEVLDAFAFRSVRIGRLESGISGALDDRGVVAVEVIFAEEFADFHFDEVEEFRIINEVNFVQEDDDLGNADLLCEEDVLTGLRHRAVNRADDEDRTVHLSGAGDHVLDVVRMSRAVDVRIVALVALVFNVGGGDCQNLRGVTTSLGFRGFRNLVVRNVIRKALKVLDVRNRSGQGGLAVVNVTDCSNVDVGLLSYKLFFCHLGASFW